MRITGNPFGNVNHSTILGALKLTSNEHYNNTVILQYIMHTISTQVETGEQPKISQDHR
jgi:hypothetical protein